MPADDPHPDSNARSRPERRVLQLTDAIYAAAVSPPLWSDFLAAMSEDLGGAAIAMSLQLPGTMLQPEYYRARLDLQYVPAFERHFRLGLPWPMTDPLFQEGFRFANRLFPDDQLIETSFYREYMEPQGLAPEGPIAHVMVADGGRPISGISIQRLQGHRRFDADDLAMCSLLVPHLARAHAIRRQFKTSQRQQGVRADLLDRIPTGIVLVDRQRRVIVSNRSGEQILDRRDGVQLDNGVLAATGRENQAALNALFDATELKAEGDPSDDFAALERPSGQRPYSVITSPLLDSSTDFTGGDRVTAVFITDPETNADRLSSSINAFSQMYKLTPAQTELISMLVDGRSLQQISNERGVTIHTTRSQLKQVFGKTGTRRQSETVRLALSGIAGVTKS